MPRIIQDEFANLNVSRQRRYQLRMEANGRCRICGAKGAPYCEKHRQKQTGYDHDRRAQDKTRPAVDPRDLV